MTDYVELEAQVATVLSGRSVALNVGAAGGASPGARVVLWDVVEVTDPATGEVLGEVKLEKLTLRVTEVHERFCIASVPSAAAEFGVMAVFGGPARRIRTGGSSGSDEVVVLRGEPASLYIPASDGAPVSDGAAGEP